MKSNMNECECEIREEGKSFKGWSDYYDFQEKITKNSVFQEIPVDKPLYNIGLEEKWYKCMLCEKIWRLVTPDPSFAGQWRKINEKEDAAHRND